MYEWEQKLQDLLASICDGTCPKEILEAISTDIGKAVSAKTLTSFSRGEDKFTIRMSNIGRDLRQLLLQKKYGREKVTPKFLMRMTFGHIYEAIFTILLTHADVEFTQAEKVKLKVDDEITINGELDLILAVDGLIWDVKTASPMAYQYKFTTWDKLEEKDDFGYFGQGFGYSEAAGIPFGGWIVIDKSSGEWKTVPIPQEEHKRLREKYVLDIKKKAKHIHYTPDVLPPCPGVEDETWQGKPTGKKILGGRCEYCPYKNGICHEKLTHKACEHSKAKTVPMKYYIE